MPPWPEFIPATDAVKIIQPPVLWSSGSAAFAPGMQPLTLAPTARRTPGRAASGMSHQGNSKDEPARAETPLAGPVRRATQSARFRERPRHGDVSDVDKPALAASVDGQGMPMKDALGLDALPEAAATLGQRRAGYGVQD